MHYNNNLSDDMYYRKRRFWYIKIWFWLIIIFSIIILIMQIVYNYDINGPQSYKQHIVNDIEFVLNHLSPDKPLYNFKDSNYYLLSILFK